MRCTDGNNLSFTSGQNSFTYRAAGLIIKDRRLLTAKHKDHPCYYTVGGKVEINETSEEAAVRECLEETGIGFGIDRLLFVQERFLELAGIRHHELVFFYLMKNPPGFAVLENSRSDQGDAETLHWLPVGELENYPLVPGFLKKKLQNISPGIEHIVSRE